MKFIIKAVATVSISVEANDQAKDRTLEFIITNGKQHGKLQKGTGINMEDKAVKSLCDGCTYIISAKCFYLSFSSKADCIHVLPVESSKMSSWLLDE